MNHTLDNVAPVAEWLVNTSRQFKQVKLQLECSVHGWVTKYPWWVFFFGPGVVSFGKTLHTTTQWCQKGKLGLELIIDSITRFASLTKTQAAILGKVFDTNVPVLSETDVKPGGSPEGKRHICAYMSGCVVDRQHEWCVWMCLWPIRWKTQRQSSKIWRWLSLKQSVLCSSFSSSLLCQFPQHSMLSIDSNT